MSVQTSYNFGMTKGVAGGLYDISPSVVDSRLNAEEDGVMMFGLGVVAGVNKGVDVSKPVKTNTSADFDGVVLNSYCAEQDKNGKVALNKGQTVNILNKGRAWVRLAEGTTPASGDALLLVVDGDFAGCFTNTAAKTAKSYTTVAVGGYFVGKKGTGDVAPAYVEVKKA